LKQSKINQKTKWYYNPLDINLIKIHPFYKHFYFERFHWPILNFWTLQTVEHEGNGTRNSMLRGR
jgi:hypothetical protein